MCYKRLPGVVVHTCNSSTQRLRQEDQEFRANLGYIARPCLKNKTKQKTSTIYLNGKVLT
jgi:hypothetical protein